MLKQRGDTIELINDVYPEGLYPFFSVLMYKEAGIGREIYVTQIPSIYNLSVVETAKLAEKQRTGKVVRSDYPTLYCVQVMKHYVAKFHDNDIEIRGILFNDEAAFMEKLNVIGENELEFVDYGEFKEAIINLEAKLK